MKALEILKSLEEVLLKHGENVKPIIVEAITELEELEKDGHYVLLQQLRKVNNTDSNDFLNHIKRTAKAILEKEIEK